MSATSAGIRLLPFIIVQVIAVISTGRLIAHFGRPYFIILLAPAFIVLGSGLLYSVTSHDPISRLLGFEVFVGLGVGMFLQNTIMVTQYEFRNQPHRMIPATGAVVFMGFLGRLWGISVAGSVFENMLQVNIHKYAPHISQDIIVAIMNAADAVWKAVPPPDRPAVITAYVKTLDAVFLIGVPAGGLGFIAALMMPVLKMDFSQHGGKQKNGRDGDVDVEKDAGAADTTTPEGDEVQPTPVPEELDSEKKSVRSVEGDEAA